MGGRVLNSAALSAVTKKRLDPHGSRMERFVLSYDSGQPPSLVETTVGGREFRAHAGGGGGQFHGALFRGEIPSFKLARIFPTSYKCRCGVFPVRTHRASNYRLGRFHNLVLQNDVPPSRARLSLTKHIFGEVQPFDHQTPQELLLSALLRCVRNPRIPCLTMHSGGAEFSP